MSVFLSVKEFIRYNLKNTALRLCADGIMENNVKKREREREKWNLSITSKLMLKLVEIEKYT